MTTVLTDAERSRLIGEFATVSGAHHRTLEALFHHPAAHNLKWTDVIALIDEIGEVHSQANDKFVFEVAGKRQLFHRPHSKDLTSTEVEDIRRFLMHSGSSPEVPSDMTAHPNGLAPDLLMVVDHHGARIFRVDVASADAAEHTIRPYDPHHFLHHLTHKDQSREQGQRTPEEPAFYEKIADAAALGGRLVIAGHGTGKSNAAHYLVDYLRKHHVETYQRVIGEIDTDLSSMTDHQLLGLARETLSASP
jgi:hypothetical protein